MKRFIVLAMMLPVLLACQREEESSGPTSQVAPQPAPPAAAPQSSQPVPPQAQQPAAPSQPAPPQAQQPAAPVQPTPPETQASTQAPPSPPAAEPAAPDAAGKTSGSSGEYTVAAGDTLSGIARDHDLNQSDLAKWNNIRNPNRIHPGQTLRLSESNS